MWMEAVNHSGTFAGLSCSRLLAYLHRNRFDGTLRVSRGPLLKLLYFQGGEIVMASSNDPGDHLAPILIREGKLKAEQLDLARKSSKAGTSLARILVQMGFLTSGELFAGARQQLRQIVGSLLGLPDAGYQIQEGYFPREITSLNVDTREMLLDLVRNIRERSLLLSEVGSPDTLYVPTPSLAAASGGERLPRIWQEYSERFNAPLTIQGFGQAAGLDDFAASKVVYGLSLLGLVQRHSEPAGEPVSAPPPGESPDQGAEGSSSEGRPTTGGERPRQDLQEETGPGLPPAEKAGAGLPSPGIPEDSRQAGASEGLLQESDSRGSRFGAQATDGESTVDIRTPPSNLPTEARKDWNLGGTVSPGRPLLALEAAVGEERHAQGGPIRLDFKGAMHSSSPGGSSRSTGSWGVFSILMGLGLLGCALFWFISYHEPTAVSPEATPPAGTVATGQESAPIGERAERGSAEQQTAGADETGTDTGREEQPTTDPANTSIQPPGDSPSAPPANPPSESEAKPPSGSPQNLPGLSAGAKEADAGGFSPFGPTIRFAEARALLDRDDFQGATALWLEMAGKETSRGFTLQIAIACKEETLRKASIRTRGSISFFAVPFSLNGSTCYRLCWGGYQSLEEAQAAKSTVPGYFLDEGGKPVVVSMAKLVSGGSH